MKIRCICKNRNNSGAIISYTLQDETGRIFQATGNEIKKEIKSKRNQFVNLQIDSLGRLVDKAEEQQPVNPKMKAEFEKTFIQKLMQDKDAQAVIEAMANELATENFTDMFSVSLYSDVYASAGGANDISDRLVVKMMNDNTIDQFIVVMSYMFEKYLAKKGMSAPYKLHIKSKDGAFEYIEYRNNLHDIKYDINAEIGYTQEYKNDPIRKKLGRNQYYFNPNNYLIKLHRLGESNAIKVYVAPDMSLICPAQNAPKSSIKPTININKQRSTSNKQVSLGKKSSGNEINSLKDWFRFIFKG